MREDAGSLFRGSLRGTPGHKTTSAYRWPVRLTAELGLGGLKDEKRVPLKGIFWGLGFRV